MVGNGTSSVSFDVEKVSVVIDWDVSPSCNSVFVSRGEYMDDDLVCQPGGHVVLLP